MGSYCELKYDNISVLSEKSYVPDHFVCLFQEADRRQGAENGEDEGYRVEYVASRDVILQRLGLLGYSAEYARQHFQEWASRELKALAEYERVSKWASEEAEALRKLDYSEWLSRARDVLLTRYDFTRPTNEYKDEIDRHLRDLSDNWLFYDGDVLPIVRSLLEVFPEVHDVTLDISDLVNGGYMALNERVCDQRRTPAPEWRSDLQPTVIIGEGSTDILVLKRSLHKLYPHLTDYFTFFDYDASSVDGGASYLVKFLRAFAAARINTNIIAIFDNDAAGLDALNVASRLPLPANIRVTRLPDIELACAYRTIGPQGEHNVNVNGRAVSIELFLGLHNLMAETGAFAPVVWGNYIQSVRQYQGAIEGKRTILERFLDETKEDRCSEYYRTRFPELVLLWEHIFGMLKRLR
jgi:hypothetical protein